MKEINRLLICFLLAVGTCTLSVHAHEPYYIVNNEK